MEHKILENGIHVYDSPTALCLDDSPTALYIQWIQVNFLLKLILIFIKDGDMEIGSGVAGSGLVSSAGGADFVVMLTLPQALLYQFLLKLSTGNLTPGRSHRVVSTPPST